MSSHLNDQLLSLCFDQPTKKMNCFLLDFVFVFGVRLFSTCCVCVCMSLYDLSVFVCFKLYYSYLAWFFSSVFVFVYRKKTALFCSNSTSNFLRCILVAFEYSQVFFWQNITALFRTLGGMLDHSVLRTGSHQPSFLCQETLTKLKTVFSRKVSVACEIFLNWQKRPE